MVNIWGQSESKFLCRFAHAVRKEVVKVDCPWTTKQHVNGDGGADLRELPLKKPEEPLEKSEESLKKLKKDISHAGEAERGQSRKRCGIRTVLVNDWQDREACI